MEWVSAIQDAIEYMEKHITDDISAEDVANQVYMSSFYFQKGFSMMCGYTVMKPQTCVSWRRACDNRCKSN